MEDVSAAQRLQLERDLYCKCLELARSDDPGPMLVEALELLRGLAGAACGYVEVQDIASNGARRWSASAGVDDVERRRIEERISRGVIAEAIETGETIHTPSALLDERFREFKSVREASIETVLCVPVRAEGVVGVVYLQNRVVGGPFLEDDLVCVENVARFVGSLAGHLLELLRRRQAEDKTTAVRSRLRSDGIVGRSAALATALERIEVIATMETNVLLTGAGGTGKSMLARVLHDNSRRARGPFVAVNCAALPEALVESELFGSERGAHSGVASKGIEGKVAAAERGTLFLDEIGELPLTVQAKVLHLVQNKEYFRLGGTRPVRADIRIVTATNRDLEDAIAHRTFREDLYYRIRSVLLEVPSLAKRREDVPALARHFCAQSCLNNGIPDMPVSAAALSAVEFADWPGNIRQLASRCEEAVVNARLDRSHRIELRHFFPQSGKDEPTPPTSFHAARQQWERGFLARTLQARDWNVAATAKESELSRSHLNALIRRYGLTRAD